MKALEIEKMFEEFLKEKEKVTSILKNIITDDKYPLEWRWSLYSIYADELLPVSSWVENPAGIDWNKHTLYDDFYIDRYEIATAIRLLKHIEDKELDVDITAFKEWWLQKGISGFKHDW